MKASCVANNRVGEEVCDGKEAFFEGEGEEGERSDGIFVVVTHVVSPHKVIFTLSQTLYFILSTHFSSIYFYIVLPAQDFWTGAETLHCKHTHIFNYTLMKNIHNIDIQNTT